MRNALLAALAALAVSAAPALAQAGVEVTPRGSDATLDVGSWNVEFFGFDDRPPNDAVQLDRVEAVVARGEIDLWGLQEVVDADDFAALLDSLADDGYAGALGPSVSGREEFDQKLAFVYDTAVITPLADPATLFPDSTFIFAGRLPLELRARVTVGDQTAEVRFITFHAKALGDQSSYERRQRAATLLKSYTDGLIAAGEAVVVLGDFNDLLTGSTRGSTFASPYAAFLADADYTAATLATEEAGLATFCGDNNDTCGGSSTIDHIVLSNATLTFVPNADNPQLQRYGELLPTTPGGGITQYTATTSDHLPVVANVRLGGGVAADTNPGAGLVALLAPAPSPFRDATALRFQLDAPTAVRLTVTDVLGRRVLAVEGAYGAGEHAVRLDGAALAPGLYVVRLAAGAEARARTLVRVR